MQVPAPFEYERATSVDHALALLERHGPEARLLAGGHSLLPMMKLRLARPETLIDINDLATSTTSASTATTIAIGAMTRHATLARLGPAGRALPDLRRRRAGHRRSDRAQPGDHRRLVVPGRPVRGPLRRLRRPAGAGRDPLAPGDREIVDMRDFPPRARTRPRSAGRRCSSRSGCRIRPGVGSAYEKVERRAGDWAVAAAGAFVQLDGDGTSPTPGSASPRSGPSTSPARRPRTCCGAAADPRGAGRPRPPAVHGTATPSPTSAARRTTSGT